MISRIDLNKPVCLDIETTGLHRHFDNITSLQIGYTDEFSGKYERKFFDWEKTDTKFLLKLLTYLKKAKLVTHNGKFDLLFIYEKTRIELNLWVDTLVLAHVCGEEELGLKPLVKKYFNVDYDIATEAKKSKITEAFTSYALDDVLYPIKLMKIFKKKLNLYDLVKVYKHEMRAYRAYYEVEKGGVPISPRRKEIGEKLKEEYMPYYERLITVADINWNSTAQVASVLFGKKNKPIYKEKGEKLPNTYEVIEYMFTGDQIVRGEFDTRKEATKFKEEYLADNNYLYGIDVKLKHNFKPVIIGYGVGLKVIEKTDKGAPSVKSDVLMNYVGNPVVDDLLEYRRLTKLETFIKSWEKIQVNDRIYPSFNITARTGRTTCSNPNLQQIPQDKNVRNLIEARPGWKLAELDFSQIELRVASMFSGDTNMQHAYQSGSDLHSKTTELLFGDTSGLSPQEQKRKRTEAKSMNFGFLYGMSAKTFVDYAKGYGLNITEEQSEGFRNDFFKAYPRLLPWHEECKAYARKNGHTWSPIGRKRFLPDINSSNWSDRGQAERQSINSGVQGFASDMCISALSDIVFSDIIDHERCKVLGSVHDAILFEIRDGYVEEVVPIIKEMMEHPSIIEGIDIPIPIIADVEVHQAWGG
jgi:DNA polymerase I-like protein with 3'-5' exonuclease and polymerase domains|nr:MAG TPA: DNA POLYMERASE [Caudoviricetes sp.]